MEFVPVILAIFLILVEIALRFVVMENCFKLNVMMEIQETEMVVQAFAKFNNFLYVKVELRLLYLIAFIREKKLVFNFIKCIKKLNKIQEFSYLR